MERMRAAGIGSDRRGESIPAPDPGYVLVLDEAGARRNDMLELLFEARQANPGAPVRVLPPAEGPGTLTPDDLGGDTRVILTPVSPWSVMEGAVAVWTVSAPAGFDAILAGHRPVVLGRPWYMGRGLSDDRQPLARRQRRLTRAQLFAAALILAPVWYDAGRDRLCSFEEALARVETGPPGLLRRLGGLFRR